MRTCVCTGIFSLGLLVATVEASAELELRLSDNYLGATPSGSPVARFAQDGDSVRLALDLGGLAGNEFVKEWYFNLEPGLNANDLRITVLGDAPFGWVDLRTTGIRAGGGGQPRFDFKLVFPSPRRADRFTAGESVDLRVDGPGGLLVDDFLSTSRRSSAGPFFSAARIRILGDTRTTAWMGASTSTSLVVPEPGTYLVAAGFLAGITGLEFARSRSRRRVGSSHPESGHDQR